MSPNSSKYEALRIAGSSPLEIARCASADGLGPLEIAMVLKKVFNFTLQESKEVWLKAEGIAESLNEYQERVILPALEEAIRDIEKEPE